MNSSFPPQEKQELDSQKNLRRNAIHGLHKYYGKLIPAIPAWAVKKYTMEGDMVLDSFCGSGTTMVEAMINRRNSVGVDIDPLAVLLSKVKTTPIAQARLEAAGKGLLSSIEDDNGSGFEDDMPLFAYVNVDYWFSRIVQKGLTIIRRNIVRVDDKDIRDFFLVCLSSIIRKVYLGDPSQIKPCRTWYVKGKRANISALRVFRKELPRKINAMTDFLKAVSSTHGVSAKVLLGDARHLPKEVGRTDLIVTNPPYIASVDYVRANKLEGWWTGVLEDYPSLRENLLGTEKAVRQQYLTFHGTGVKEIDEVIREIYGRDRRKGYVVYKYFEDMRDIMAEWKRVLRPGGKIVIKTSESRYQGVSTPTPRFMIKLAEEAGLSSFTAFQDRIRSRSLSRIRHPTGGLIERDWILVLEKEAR
jgi:DNA modification methylase